MNPKSISHKMIADYEERRKSLLADGYIQRHETILVNGVVCRLHHMSNGNDIILSAVSNKLIQKTNHIVTYAQTY